MGMGGFKDVRDVVDRIMQAVLLKEEVSVSEQDYTLLKELFSGAQLPPIKPRRRKLDKDLLQIVGLQASVLEEHYCM